MCKVSRNCGAIRNYTDGWGIITLFGIVKLKVLTGNPLIATDSVSLTNPALLLRVESVNFIEINSAPNPNAL